MSLNKPIETRERVGFDCIGWMKQAGFAEAASSHWWGAASIAIGIK
jgi:hypothetical protein